MRESYNTFDFWEEKVNKNKTIRAHMFMDKLPNEKSIYVHTLNFSNNNGIENVYSYFPNAKTLLGYIQYSFLQEAFYRWMYGTEKVILEVPFDLVTNTVSNGLKNKKITKEEADEMFSEYEEIVALWDSTDNEILKGIIRFSRRFNKYWLGDNSKFLYIKIYETINDFYKFVEEALSLNVGIEEESNVGITLEEWKDTCLKALKDTYKAKEFREMLIKKLTETL